MSGAHNSTKVSGRGARWEVTIERNEQCSPSVPRTVESDYTHKMAAISCEVLDTRLTKLENLIFGTLDKDAIYTKVNCDGSSMIWHLVLGTHDTVHCLSLRVSKSQSVPVGVSPDSDKSHDKSVAV